MAMNDFANGLTSHLRLWANTSAFTGFLPHILSKYSNQHPKTALDLEDAWSEDIVEAVINGVAELGIIGENSPTKGLAYKVCYVDELVLLLPRRHKFAHLPTIDFSKVHGLDFISLPKSTSLTRQLTAEVGHDALRVRVQVRGFDEMCRMISAGLGVGILPRTCVSPLAGSLGLSIHHMTGLNVERRLLLVARDLEALSPPAQSFIEILNEIDVPAVPVRTPTTSSSTL